MPAAPILLSGLAVSGLSATIGTALAGIAGATVSTAAATAIGTGVIAGAATALRGGNVSDVLKTAITSGAASFAGAKVGNFVGSQVSSAISGTTGTLASKVLSGVATGVTESLIKGQDLSQGALFGAASGLVQSFDTVFANNKDWQSLGKVGQSAIKAATAAGITGQDMSEAAITAAINASDLVAKAVNISPEFKNLLGDPSKSSAAQIALGAVSNTISGLLSGKPLSDAAQQGILRSTGQYLGKLAKSNLDEFVKEAKQNYEIAEKARPVLEQYEQKEAPLIQQYNEIANTINAKLKEREALMAEYEQRKSTIGQQVQIPGFGYMTITESSVAKKMMEDGLINKINATTEELNTYADLHAQDMNRVRDELAILQEERRSVTAEYQAALNGLETSSQKINAETSNIVTETKQAMVAGLDENFNSAEYQALHPEATDPYEHYLTKGYTENLPTSFEAAAQREFREQGFDATAKDIENMVSEMSSGAFVGWGGTNKVSPRDFIADYVDRNIQTPDEVRQIAQDIGIPLTDEQIEKLSGNRTSKELMSEMWGMLDPYSIREITQQPNAIASVLAESAAYKNKTPLAKSYIADAVGDAATAIYADSQLTDEEKKQKVADVISKIDTGILDSAVRNYESVQSSHSLNLRNLHSQAESVRLEKSNVQSQIDYLSRRSFDPSARFEVNRLTSYLQNLNAREDSITQQRDQEIIKQQAALPFYQQRLESAAYQYGSSVKETVAKSLNKDFNAYEYSIANNVPLNQAADHYLAQGRAENLPANYREFVQKQFEQSGYKATEQEISKLAQEMYQAADKNAAIAQYINTGTTTSEEVANTAKSMNVTLTPAQVASLVGQQSDQDLTERIRSLADQIPPQEVISTPATKDQVVLRPSNAVAENALAGMKGFLNTLTGLPQEAKTAVSDYLQGDSQALKNYPELEQATKQAQANQKIYESFSSGKSQDLAQQDPETYVSAIISLGKQALPPSFGQQITPEALFGGTPGGGFQSPEAGGWSLIRGRDPADPSVVGVYANQDKSRALIEYENGTSRAIDLATGQITPLGKEQTQPLIVALKPAQEPLTAPTAPVIEPTQGAQETKPTALTEKIEKPGAPELAPVAEETKPPALAEETEKPVIPPAEIVAPNVSEPKPQPVGMPTPVATEQTPLETEKPASSPAPIGLPSAPSVSPAEPGLDIGEPRPQPITEPRPITIPGVEEITELETAKPSPVLPVTPPVQPPAAEEISPVSVVAPPAQPPVPTEVPSSAAPPVAPLAPTQGISPEVQSKLAAIENKLATFSVQTGQGFDELKSGFDAAFKDAQAKGATADAALQAGIDAVGKSSTAAQKANEEQLKGLGVSISGLEAGQAGLEQKYGAIDKKLADFATQTGQNFADIKSQFDQGMRDAQARGESADAALQAGIDVVGKTAAANQKATEEQLRGLGTSVSGIQKSQEELAAQQQSAQKATETRFGSLEQTFNTRVDDLVKQGASYQAATNQALSELRGGQSGLQQQQEQTQTQIGALESQFNQRVNDLMRQGQTYQMATNQAIAEVTAGQAKLGETIGGVKTGLEQQISGVQTGLGQQISGITQAMAAQQQAAAQAQQSQKFQNLLAQFMAVPAAATIAQPALPKAPLTLQTKARNEEFQGPLAQFFKRAGVEEYQPEQTQPEQQEMASYFNYGQQSDIEDILGQDQYQFASGGLAAPLMAAKGGLPSKVVHHSGKARVDFRDGAHVSGPGDGQSDDIPAMLADGEFVFPADVVSALGNGSTKAGSDKLYEMMHKIRDRARSAGPKDLPPPAKSPLDYLKGSRKSRR